MAEFDFFGRKMFGMDGFMPVAPRVATYPNVVGPPPYGIWAVTYTEDAVEEARGKAMGQGAAPAKTTDVFSLFLGLASIGVGVAVGSQGGKGTLRNLVAPGAAILAGGALVVKSL